MTVQRGVTLCLGVLWVMIIAWAWAGGVEAGEVRGVVRMEGSPPAPEVVTIEPKTGVHSTEGCGNLAKASPRLRVDPSGGVQDAVVWLAGSLEMAGEAAGEAAGEVVVLDQRTCVFEPHVVVLRPGQPLAIRNSDSVLHNIRIFRGVAMLMHQWQKADAADIAWRFEQPGRYLVRCGVHPWMYAWVVVVPARAGAVTDAAGQFLLPEMPPGRWTLHVWHETLGDRAVPVQVGAADTILDPVVLAPS